MAKYKEAKKIPLHIILIIFSISAIFPFYYMIITGFKTNNEFYENTFLPPVDWSIENIKSLFFEHNFLIFFRNSAIVTIGSVLIALVVSSLAAYAYAKMKFRGNKFLLGLTITLTGIPPIIVVVPMYVLMSKISMLNTFTGINLIYSGFMLPFSIFVLTGFFRSIPDDLLHAASIDGCNRLQLLYRIILPLSKPALTTIIIINSLWVWNELLIALMFLRSENMRTINIALAQIGGRYAINPTLVQAGALFVTIPILIIYLIGQRFFVKGISAGALKE